VTIRASFERLGAIRATAGGLAVAVDPRIAPLLEPGSVTTHPLVVMAVLLFDGEIVTGAEAKPCPYLGIRGGHQELQSRHSVPPAGSTHGKFSRHLLA
jgi:hypothetical protein